MKEEETLEEEVLLPLLLLPASESAAAAVVPPPPLAPLALLSSVSPPAPCAVVAATASVAPPSPWAPPSLSSLVGRSAPPPSSSLLRLFAVIAVAVTVAPLCCHVGGHANEFEGLPCVSPKILSIMLPNPTPAWITKKQTRTEHVREEKAAAVVVRSSISTRQRKAHSRPWALSDAILPHAQCRKVRGPSAPNPTGNLESTGAFVEQTWKQRVKGAR